MHTIHTKISCRYCECVRVHAGVHDRPRQTHPTRKRHRERPGVTAQPNTGHRGRAHKPARAPWPPAAAGPRRVLDGWSARRRARAAERLAAARVVVAACPRLRTVVRRLLTPAEATPLAPAHGHEKAFHTVTVGRCVGRRVGVVRGFGNSQQSLLTPHKASVAEARRPAPRGIQPPASSQTGRPWQQPVDPQR